ncbi:C1 family peptidase [Nibricoccus sp. IMCC34717]|uniref:C1 family peptidase n=1 Tax=Nibricoccus sp. IMCC34717 TaxID=3034021 RepID=UPI003850D573
MEPIAHPRRRLALLSLAIACLTAAPLLPAAETDSPPPAGVGASAETVTIKGITYHALKLRSVSRTGLVLQHSGGLLSVPWGDLPEKWRLALASQIPRDVTPTPTVPPKAVVIRKASAKAAATPAPAPAGNEKSAALRALFSSLGTKPAFNTSVDLRPALRDFGMWIKNQGPQPSCSVYAILGAVEYQYAQKIGKPVRFDPQGLLDATEAVTKRRRFADAADPAADAGFTLPEVVDAIRKHGLRVSEEYLQETLHRDPEAAAATLPAPRVTLHFLPDTDRSVAMLNLVHALNAGLPVPIGLRFPTQRAAKSGYLDTQPVSPEGGHAVTLVGYECPDGKPESLVFLFRNSWGVQWGAGGYGRATAKFLRDNLVCAVVLEVD